MTRGGKDQMQWICARKCDAWRWQVMIDSIAVSLFVDRLSLSNQKQKATGDEAAERVKAVAWR